MLKSKNSTGAITINGISFLDFVKKYSRKKFINSNGNHIHKYQVFWLGLTDDQLRKSYDIIDA
jgi:hypothetical protein